MTEQEKMLAKNRRGRPATGKGVQVVVRLQPDLLAWVDAERARIMPQPSRPEFIRRAVYLTALIARDEIRCGKCDAALTPLDFHRLYQNIISSGALEWRCSACGRGSSVPLFKDGMDEF